MDWQLTSAGVEVNTRFVPTCNGYLHLGHAYIALVNEHMAHSTGGTFTLRLDDAQPNWLAELGSDAIWAYGEAAAVDLDWFGISVDQIYHECILQHYPFLHDAINQLVPGASCGTGVFPTPVLVGSGVAQYPYSRFLTAEKVVFDKHSDIDCIIRGAELIDEYSLYCEYRERMGWQLIPHYYLSRLRANDGELSNVSKTAGNYRLRDLRQKGYTPGQLRDALAQSCLQNPLGAWSVDNLMSEPILEEI